MNTTSDPWMPSSSHPTRLEELPKLALAQKKPRHRHSPTQLAALNELFEKNEHPPLELRISLAERLGMETKTVNAWFQNKRASSRKRTRGAPHIDVHSVNKVNANSAPSSTSNLPHLAEFDDYHDDETSSLDSNQIHLVPDMSHQYHHSVSHYYSENGDALQYCTETEPMPRRMRMRPTHEQTEELKNLYSINPHPTTEQRQALSERIGMRYQSITNWFQNQRSLAKKKTNEETDVPTTLHSEYVLERQYSAYPPPQDHPSLVLSPKYNAHSIPYHEMQCCPKFLLPPGGPTSRKPFYKRITTSYDTAPSTASRPRRSRPEPYQLDALKQLFTKTSTPSIEERSALAAEIGMDLGRVTNWFRNLRQTSRKRAKKTGSSEDDDDYHSLGGHDKASGPFSRSVTPSQHSSSPIDDNMELDETYYEVRQSDVGSDDEYQEAVTPSPEPLLSTATEPARVSIGAQSSASDLSSCTDLEKTPTAEFPGVRVEDALLLLSFHQHVVH
ncbi:hypothetical protein AX17_000552 [Amanita inopinata Kibby_2008]|nr:hypothetical protein AX17_000552 [Amanita inopinata Kibby_2008]